MSPFPAPARRWRAPLALLACTALLAAACGDAQLDEAGGADTAGTDTTRDPADAVVRADLERLRPPTLGEATPVVSPQSLDERDGLRPLPGAPVFDGDYADPFVLEVGSALYLYTTNTFGANVPVLISGAGVVAVPAGDALPELPAWTRPGQVWAPSVLERDGSFVLYYTSEDIASGLQCIGVAVAEGPVGPFAHDSDEPLVCQRELGGTIDASPFVDPDGTPWLLYKSDGNCCEQPTQLFVQQLSADATSLAGEPVALLTTDQPWEDPLVEAPSMVERDGTYWLFYSANWWDTAGYSIGVARCESVTGPCTKHDGPWLAGHGEATGPGGAETFVDQRGDPWIVYHAWVTDQVGYDGGGARALFAQPVDLTGEWPVPAGTEGP